MTISRLLQFLLLHCGIFWSHNDRFVIRTVQAFQPSHIITTTNTNTAKTKSFSSLFATVSSSSTKPVVTDCVFKFGGSSLANAERVDHVANLIKDQIANGFRPRAVVCSAMGKTTNNLLSAGQQALGMYRHTNKTHTHMHIHRRRMLLLLKIQSPHALFLFSFSDRTGGSVSLDTVRELHESTIAHLNLDQTHTATEVRELLQECEQLLHGIQLLEEISPSTWDQLVSTGERCAVRILAARLNQIGIPAEAYDAWQVGIFTNSQFGNADLIPDYDVTIKHAFLEQRRIDPNTVAVVTGFLGKEDKPKKGRKGKITTLGRGGSDLSATAIGASLGVDEVQVWKDVDGILTTDPNVVPHAKP
jgi:aspartate kinase